ncbi:MAG TPA: HAMP domain-containing sensor histidine kinase [Thermoanaerobaculia bacterium]|nr:HAMP domain-containing sensor histidine kinase [Thermoanaerobaculia bacterium]
MSYFRYRAFAYRAFDTDLADNLRTLQRAYAEELKETVRKTGEDPLRRAARETLDAYRLSGMAAEIRDGADGATLLGIVSEDGADDAPSFLPSSRWREIARSDALVVLPLRGELRGAIQTTAVGSRGDRVTIAVAGDARPLVASVATFRLFLIELAVGGVLLAVAGGYWLAKRTLHPIAALTDQVEGMAASTRAGASHRVAVMNPDDEIGRLASVFNRLLARIDASAQQVRTFIADAAHEMKTPVAIVRTEAELSLGADRSREDLREALAAIANESERLSRLVRDLTLLAEGQVLEQPVERRLVDLAELVRDVIHGLRSFAAERRVLVGTESRGSVEYKGDERLLRQILSNLVENAIKFSPPSTLIDVRVSHTVRGHEIEVLDQAPTLTAEERVRVFERFYRAAASRGSGVPGSGLGLAIVEWAVKLHGGTVCVEPRPMGRGNRFVVVLPPESEASPEKIVADVRAAAGARLSGAS